MTALGSNRFYQTTLVEAAEPRGCRQVRVLLDGGSDTSYLRASLAEELGLPVTGTDTFACIGFQEKVEEPHPYNRVQITLRSRFDNNTVELELFSTDRLCSALPVNTELPESLHTEKNWHPFLVLAPCQKCYLKRGPKSSQISVFGPLFWSHGS